MSFFADRPVARSPVPKVKVTTVRVPEPMQVSVLPNSEVAHLPVARFSAKAPGGSGPCCRKMGSPIPLRYHLYVLGRSWTRLLLGIPGTTLPPVSFINIDRMNDPDFYHLAGTPRTPKTFLGSKQHWDAVQRPRVQRGSSRH